jgi:hypothetical protein
MLSFEKLKELIILVLTFGIIYWFQYVDDKKRCKKRVGIYEKIKLPLLVSCIVGLVLFWEKDSVLAIFIAKESCQPSNHLQVPKLPALSEFLPQNKYSKIEGDFRPSKPEFDVYTELPEW